MSRSGHRTVLYLGRPVMPRADNGAVVLILKSRAAEVNDLYLAAAGHSPPQPVRTRNAQGHE